MTVNLTDSMLQLVRPPFGGLVVEGVVNTLKPAAD
jgi:hypothetical protein